MTALRNYWVELGIVSLFGIMVVALWLYVA